MTPSDLLQLPWQLVVSAAVAVLLVVILLVRTARRIAQRTHKDELFSQITMIVALGWSADAMWIIARDKAHLPLGVTILLFTVFEASLLLSMSRAKKHLAEYGWPGRPGVTAWGIAGLMSVAAIVASTSIPEAIVRMFIPFMVTKLWWDGLVSGAPRRSSSTVSWRWTPRRLLLAVGAIEPGERDVETVHRERLTQTMTRLEYLRRHGSKKLVTRRGARLARLSLTADDAIIFEVRQRVSRATWFTVTPLTQGTTQALAHLGDAATAQGSGASTPRVNRVNNPVTSNDAVDASEADAATQAAHLVLANRRRGVKLPVREAARQFPGASEPTVRRRIKEIDGAPATQPVAQVNGHKIDAEGVPMARL